MTEPSEGLYLLGELDYDSIGAVNISTLVNISVSPKYYKWRLDHPRDSDAFRLGNATDRAVFEPERFARMYAIWTGFDEETGEKRIRSGKYWDQWQMAHAGQIILTQDEYDTALNMRRVVESDPLAMSYLDNGHPQVTLIWRDKETGLLCKGRPDWITENNAIPDLKTAKSVVPWALCRDGTKFHYHVKMAWYADAFEQITMSKPSEVVLISVEKTAPFDVVVYDMDDERVLDYGRSEYRAMMDTLRRCLDSGKWPGIGNGAKVPFVLPKYARNDDDEQDGALDGLEFGEVA